jgi:hypothetical protein
MCSYAKTMTGKNRSMCVKYQSADFIFKEVFKIIKNRVTGMTKKIFLSVN